MIQHFTIHVQHEMDDNAPVIQITDPVEKENINHRIIQEDKIWNAKIAAYPDQNSYDNDDHLFICLWAILYLLWRNGRYTFNFRFGRKPPYCFP